MPNIFLKVKAWQLTWLKRAVLKPHSTWVLINNEMLKNITFPEVISNQMNMNSRVFGTLPIFYKNILQNWFDLKQYSNGTTIADEFLWFNKYITIDGSPIFWERWYMKGIKYIRNLLDDNGNFQSTEDFNRKYDLNTIFLSLYQIRNALPFSWRSQLRKLPRLDQVNGMPMIKLKEVSEPAELPKIKSRQFYWLFIKIDHNKANTRPACINKWQNSFLLEDEAWSSIFTLTFSICKCTKLQSFQYRLLHRIISCNHWLFIAKIKDTPSCKYCKLDDTIEHFFWHCTDVANFGEGLLHGGTEL